MERCESASPTPSTRLHRRNGSAVGRAGDDEVVRISDEVYLWADGFSVRILPGEVLLQEWFQSVQSQVGQRGRDNPALWRACLRRKEDSIFHEPGFEPFTQHFLVGGHMAEHPFVTDVVETTANVALQHPRRTVLVGHPYRLGFKRRLISEAHMRGCCLRLVSFFLPKLASNSSRSLGLIIFTLAMCGPRER